MSGGRSSWRAKPELERDSAGLEGVNPPPRKLDVLVDEDLEIQLVREIRASGHFRVSAMNVGTPDSEVWRDARQRRLCIITADVDFWNDVLYPLEQSPGVIILRGATSAERLAALEQWWKDNDTMVRMGGAEVVEGRKWRVSRGDVHGKFVDGDAVVETDF